MVAGVVIGLGAVLRGLAADSASYRAGEVVGTVVVVIAAACLFLWGSAERDQAGRSRRRPA
jgi:predicted MFS family arabinose efflux permease